MKITNRPKAKQANSDAAVALKQRVRCPRPVVRGEEGDGVLALAGGGHRRHHPANHAVQLGDGVASLSPSLGGLNNGNGRSLAPGRQHGASRSAATWPRAGAKTG